jgi:hypothetical protein
MSTAPVPGPSNWQNQELTLYHGTLDRHVQSILKGVQINQGRASTDLGQGFYTTTLLRQAWSWAWQLSQRQGGQPAVVWFQVDRDALADLDSIWFVRGNFDADDFWSLVWHCRRGSPNHGRPGWYDVAIGPVASSWRQRQTIYDADQVSFHTQKAADLLDNSRKGE